MTQVCASENGGFMKKSYLNNSIMAYLSIDDPLFSIIAG